MEKKGAGEILIISVDRDGTGLGMDEHLINDIYESVNIPIVASGGIGTQQHVVNTFKNVNVSGLAISSSFHYEYVLKQNKINTLFSEGNTSFLLNKRSLSNIEEINLLNLKEILLKEKVSVRN